MTGDEMNTYLIKYSAEILRRGIISLRSALVSVRHTNCRGNFCIKNSYKYSCTLKRLRTFSRPRTEIKSADSKDANLPIRSSNFDKNCSYS